jgi:Protein of unknown function (DUF3106)
MSLLPLSICRVAALLGASHLLLAALPAQAAATGAVSAPANSTHARPPMPSLPPALSPISFFRDLLAMDAASREQALTNRPPEIKAQILAKVREYESLKPDERELRLRVTELRWYLRPLMSAPATNRPAQLTLVPETYRKLVEDRLQEWDKLSPDLQAELLANESTIRYLTEIEGRTEEQRRQTLEAIPLGGRTVLERGIDKWSSLSEDRRQRMLSRFREFFELTAQEKRKVINTLPGLGRGQIEKTMRALDDLPSDQRDQCIRSLEKFASLNLAERQQFLKSAERWKLMSPSERQVWRELVRRFPPLPPPPLPPLPRSLRPTPPVLPIATNRN